MPMMNEKLRYRKHTPLRPKLLGLVRVTFCVVMCVFCLARAGQGIRVGEMEAPLRAANLIVTTASPAWFALALLFYCFMGIVFAYASYGLTVRLIEDFRS